MKRHFAIVAMLGSALVAPTLVSAGPYLSVRSLETKRDCVARSTFFLKEAAHIERVRTTPEGNVLAETDLVTVLVVCNRSPQVSFAIASRHKPLPRMADDLEATLRD